MKKNVNFASGSALAAIWRETMSELRVKKRIPPAKAEKIRSSFALLNDVKATAPTTGFSLPFAYAISNLAREIDGGQGKVYSRFDNKRHAAVIGSKSLKAELRFEVAKPGTFTYAKNGSSREMGMGRLEGIVLGLAARLDGKAPSTVEKPL